MEWGLPSTATTTVSKPFLSRVFPRVSSFRTTNQLRSIFFRRADKCERCVHHYAQSAYAVLPPHGISSFPMTRPGSLAHKLKVPNNY
jgi:hypothetical protein